jgi:hypothetical protein
VPLRSESLSGNALVTASSKVSVRLVTERPPPVCDIRSTLALAPGLTRSALTSCGKVWVNPLSVAVALVTTPTKPVTVMVAGYGVAMP